QARFNYKDLFIQGFMNTSNGGDTFILRSGQLIVDTSKLFVGQIQHSYELGQRQRFTYGLDALFTRPNTDGTINGRNEDQDDIDEIGVYLQSETDITSALKFVGAARIDKHSELEDPVFSPRAALVLKPSATDNFRITYNRAFSTPTTNNLFLDILNTPDAFGIGAAFAPALGFSPNIDIRAQGVPETGFSFRRGPNGLFMFRSPFAPLDPRGLTNSSFIELNDAIFTNVMWSVGSGAVSSQFVPQYVAGLIAAGVDPVAAQALGQQFLTIVPALVGGVGNVMRSLDPETGTFFEDEPFDVPRIKEETTQTLEFGYKGILGEKLVLDFDVYYTKIEDFITPLLVTTPNVFLDPVTLAAFLGPSFATELAKPENAMLNATLVGALDAPASGGNGNGSAVDELTGMYTAGAAGIPFGTVTPQEVFDPTAVLVTYRNIGDVDFVGLDVSFSYYLNRLWTIGGNYSFVSDDVFENLDGIDDIALNAAKHKFGASISYRNRDAGFDSNLRLRFVDSFPVISADFKGTSDRYAVLDLTANYKLPFSRNTNLNLTIQNLTDNKHLEIVGAPEIGRLAIVRVTQSF
ncbi:MAG: TonB-dependent receptor domain-containing protein, partial [bacterium]